MRYICRRFIALTLCFILFCSSGMITYAEDLSSSGGTYSYISPDGDWTFSIYPADDGTPYIYLDKYNGDDKIVNIPPSITYNNETLPVYAVGEAFCGNTNVEVVNVHKDCILDGSGELPFYDATALKAINVEEGNEWFFSRDGVLYTYKYNSHHGKSLVHFPAAYESNVFCVPYDVRIAGAAFRNLSGKTIIIPYLDTYYIAQHSFMDAKNCTFVVKTPEIQHMFLNNDEINVSPAYGSTNCEVLLEEDMDAEEKVMYGIIPATGITLNMSNATVAPDSPYTHNTDGTMPRFNSDEHPYVKLTCNTFPLNTTDNVTWTSSNPDVALVTADSTGYTSVTTTSKGTTPTDDAMYVYGINSGTAVITATTDSGISASCTVKVYQPITKVDTATQKITIDLANSNHYYSASLRITPGHASNRSNITWSSSNPSIVSMQSTSTNQDGLKESIDFPLYTYTMYCAEEDFIVCPKFAFHKTGTATITATIKDEGKVYKKQFVITIINSKASNSSNTSNSSSTTAKKSQKITKVGTWYTLSRGSKKTLKPKAKTSVSYTTSNPKVATVNSKGRITAKGYGKAVITIKAKSTSKYKSATKKITVKVIPKKMTLTSVKAGKRQISVKWKKDSSAKKYYLQYSTDKKFKKNVKTKSISKSKSSYTIKKLKKGKRYYVRICAYNKYKGSYSKVKSCKVK